MDITGIIEGYLQENRRLVVPSLGAFLVKDSGEVLFSELLKADDGVLSSLLAEEGLGELERDGIIDRFVFDVKYELDTHCRCRFGRLGEFVRGINGAVLFSGSVNNLKGDVEVLQPVVEATVVQPIAEVETVIESEPEIEPVSEPEPALRPEPDEAEVSRARPMDKPRRKKRGTDWFVVVAVVVLLAAVAAIGYGYWCSTLVDDEAEMEALRWQVEQPAPTE